jgi:hypothetical protein
MTIGEGIFWEITLQWKNIEGEMQGQGGLHVVIDYERE